MLAHRLRGKCLRVCDRTTPSQLPDHRRATGMALGALTLAALALSAAAAASPDSVAQLALSINSKKMAALVSDRFLSVTVDPAQLKEQGGHGAVRTLAMARGLSPLYVRVAGPSSDALHFSRTPGKTLQDAAKDNRTVSDWELRALVEWAREVGGLELILCLNALDRAAGPGGPGGAWDSRNTLDLLAFADSEGYPLSWQFGYESGALERAGVSGPQLGADMARAAALLAEFPRYQGALMLGPDVAGQALHYFQDATRLTAPDAIVWQPWSEGREQAHDHDLQREDVNRLMGRAAARRPLWMAESVTKEPTSRFVDAIQWAQRVQVAARLGADVIFRRPGDLLGDGREPSPDFWVSLLHKRLCGRAVLDSRAAAGPGGPAGPAGGANVSVVAHCTVVPPASARRTAPRLTGSFARLGYERGDMTLLAVNRGATATRATLRLTPVPGMHQVAVHEYVLTSPDDSSRLTLLNGRPLTLGSGGGLPSLTPQVREAGRDVVLTLPPHSVAFFVFPGAHARACQAAPEDAPDPEVAAGAGARVVLGPTSDQEMHVRFEMDEDLAPVHKSKAKEKLARTAKAMAKPPGHVKDSPEHELPVEPSANIKGVSSVIRNHLERNGDIEHRRRRAVQEKPRKYSPEDWAEKLKKSQQAWKKKPFPVLPFPDSSEETMEYEGLLPVAPLYRPEELKLPKPAQIKPLSSIKSPAMKSLLKKPSHPAHLHHPIPAAPKFFKPIPNGAALTASLMDPNKGSSSEDESVGADRKRSDNPFPEGAVLVEVGDSEEERANSREDLGYVSDDDREVNAKEKEREDIRFMVKNMSPQDLLLDSPNPASPSDRYYYGPGEYYSYLKQQFPTGRPKRPHSDSEFGEFDLFVEPIDGRERQQPPPSEPHLEEFAVVQAVPPPPEEDQRARIKAEQQVQQFYENAAKARKDPDDVDLDSAENIDTKILLQLGKQYLREQKMKLKNKKALEESKSDRQEKQQEAVSTGTDYGTLQGDRLARLGDGEGMQRLEESRDNSEPSSAKGSQTNSSKSENENEGKNKREKRDTPVALRSKRAPPVPARSRIPIPSPPSLRNRQDSPRPSTSTALILPRGQNSVSRVRPSSNIGSAGAPTNARAEQRSAAFRSLQDRLKNERSERDGSIRERLEKARQQRPQPAGRAKRSDDDTYRAMYESFGTTRHLPPMDMNDDEIQVLAKSKASSERYRYGHVPEERNQLHYDVFNDGPLVLQDDDITEISADNDDSAAGGAGDLLYGQTPRHTVSTLADGTDQVWDGRQLTIVERNKIAPDGHEYQEAYVGTDTPSYHVASAVNKIHSHGNHHHAGHSSWPRHHNAPVVYSDSAPYRAAPTTNQRSGNSVSQNSHVQYLPEEQQEIEYVESPHMPHASKHVQLIQRKQHHQHLYHRDHLNHHNDKNVQQEEPATTSAQKECSGQGFGCYFRYFLSNSENADEPKEELVVKYPALTQDNKADEVFTAEHSEIRHGAPGVSMIQKPFITHTFTAPSSKYATLDSYVPEAPQYVKSDDKPLQYQHFAYAPRGQNVYAVSEALEETPSYFNGHIVQRYANSPVPVQKKYEPTVYEAGENVPSFQIPCRHIDKHSKTAYTVSEATEEVPSYGVTNKFGNAPIQRNDAHTVYVADNKLPSHGSAYEYINKLKAPAKEAYTISEADEEVPAYGVTYKYVNAPRTEAQSTYEADEKVRAYGNTHEYINEPVQVKEAYTVSEAAEEVPSYGATYKYENAPRTEAQTTYEADSEVPVYGNTYEYINAPAQVKEAYTVSKIAEEVPSYGITYKYVNSPNTEEQTIHEADKKIPAFGNTYEYINAPGHVKEVHTVSKVAEEVPSDGVTYKYMNAPRIEAQTSSETDSKVPAYGNTYKYINAPALVKAVEEVPSYGATYKYFDAPIQRKEARTVYEAATDEQSYGNSYEYQNAPAQVKEGPSYVTTYRNVHIPNQRKELQKVYEAGNKVPSTNYEYLKPSVDTEESPEIYTEFPSKITEARSTTFQTGHAYDSSGHQRGLSEKEEFEEIPESIVSNNYHQNVYGYPAQVPKRPFLSPSASYFPSLQTYLNNNHGGNKKADVAVVYPQVRLVPPEDESFQYSDAQRAPSSHSYQAFRKAETDGGSQYLLRPQDEYVESSSEVDTSAPTIQAGMAPVQYRQHQPPSTGREAFKFATLVKPQGYDIQVDTTSLNHPGEQVDVPEQELYAHILPIQRRPQHAKVQYASVGLDTDAEDGVSVQYVSAPRQPARPGPHHHHRSRRSIPFRGHPHDERGKKVMLDTNQIAQQLPASAETLTAAPATREEHENSIVENVDPITASKSLDHIQALLGSLLDMSQVLKIAEADSGTAPSGDPSSKKEKQEGVLDGNLFDVLPWSLFKQGEQGKQGGSGGSSGNIPVAITTFRPSEPNQPDTITEMANLDWLQAREKPADLTGDDIDDEEWSAETDRMRRRRLARQREQREQQQQHQGQQQQGPVPGFVSGIVTAMLSKVASVIGYLTNLTKFKDSSRQQ